MLIELSKSRACHLQTENTSTPEGWAKLDHAESGEAPNIMDEGELPVDANGNYVSGVPVDPEDPRTAHMKPAGKTSPPARPGVSTCCLLCSMCQINAWSTAEQQSEMHVGAIVCCAKSMCCYFNWLASGLLNWF